jgi:hypothetical protein
LDIDRYVGHILLNDVVERGYVPVGFLGGFEGFAGGSLPAASVAEHHEYTSRPMAFIRA